MSTKVHYSTWVGWIVLAGSSGVGFFEKRVKKMEIGASKMETKKRKLVFFQASGDGVSLRGEKEKNENLIVHAGVYENCFSFFRFPSHVACMPFDPEYAARVAAEVVDGPPRSTIVEKSFLDECWNCDFPEWSTLPFGISLLVLPLFCDTLDRVLSRMSQETKGKIGRFLDHLSKREKDLMGRCRAGVIGGLDDLFPSVKPDDAAGRDAVNNLGEMQSWGGEWKPVKSDAAGTDVVDAAGNADAPPVSQEFAKAIRDESLLVLGDRLSEEMNRVAAASADPRDAGPEMVAAANDVFRSAIPKDSQKKSPIWKDKRRGILESDSMPEKAAPLADRELPPNFVLADLPDDGKPWLDYSRSPGWYWTRRAGLVDVTYNVGTGVDPTHAKLPWVHCKNFQSRPQEYVFYDVNGLALIINDEKHRSMRRIPDFDIVKRCVNLAAKTKEDVQEQANEQVNEQADSESLEGRIENLTVRLEDADRMAKTYQGLYQDAIDSVDEAFQDTCSRDAILSGYVRLGGNKFHAVPRLAREHKSLLVEVEKLHSEIVDLQSRLHAKEKVIGNISQSLFRANNQLAEVGESHAEILRERDQIRADFERTKQQYGAATDHLVELGDVVRTLQSEREPVDNGNGTVTQLLPVTYRKQWSGRVVAARAVNRGDWYVRTVDESEACSSGSARPDCISLILSTPEPANPEPVTWRCSLLDGKWFANDEGVRFCPGGSTIAFYAWGFAGITQPPQLGRYLFRDGVGTLITDEPKKDEGSK